MAADPTVQQRLDQLHNDNRRRGRRVLVLMMSGYFLAIGAVLLLAIWSFRP